MQCKHTWHALGFRNQNLRHGRPNLLGESTPPQGVNVLILPYPYLLYLRGKGVSHVQIDQSDKDTLHHVDKPCIGLILLGLVRLHFEAFGFGVAILTVVTA
jgi:hypothetical protein